MKRFQKTVKIAKGKPPVCPRCKGTGLSQNCSHGKQAGSNHPLDFITVRNHETGKEERRVRSRCDGKPAACGMCTGLGFLLIRK